MAPCSGVEPPSSTPLEGIGPVARASAIALRRRTWIRVYVYALLVDASTDERWLVAALRAVVTQFTGVLDDVSSNGTPHRDVGDNDKNDDACDGEIAALTSRFRPTRRKPFLTRKVWDRIGR